MLRSTGFANALLCSFLLIQASAAAQSTEDSSAASPRIQLVQSPTLDRLLTGTAREILESRRASGLKESDLAISLIDLSGLPPFASASFRGDAKIYPASVVKLFYLVAAHQQMHDGELKNTVELRRALRDMIVDSSNDATHYVVDALTETSSGVELPDAEMQEWAHKRNRVNRYFVSLGYKDINVNQKTYCENVYGRDRVFRGAKAENRNVLTSDATARLLAEIATGSAASAAHSREMLDLLKRDPYQKGGDSDNQASGFTGRALNGGVGEKTPDVKLWSKAGWTSTTRHDAAYVELPGGRRFVLVTFTTNHSTDKDIIPTVARTVIDKLRRMDLPAADQ